MYGACCRPEKYTGWGVGMPGWVAGQEIRRLSTEVHFCSSLPMQELPSLSPPNNVQFASAYRRRMRDKRAARWVRGPVDEGDPSKWHPQSQYESLVHDF